MSRSSIHIRYMLLTSAVCVASALIVAVLGTGSAEAAQLPAPGGCAASAVSSSCSDALPGIDRGVSALAAHPNSNATFVLSGNDGLLRMLAREADGALTKIDSPGSCASADPAQADCTFIPELDGATDVEVASDGALLAIASPTHDAVVTVELDTFTGQLIGTPHCVSAGGAGGCLAGRALTGVDTVTLSPNGHLAIASSRAGTTLAAIAVDPITHLASQAGDAHGCATPDGLDESANPTCGNLRGPLPDGTPAFTPDGSTLLAPGSVGGVTEYAVDATGLQQLAGDHGCVVNFDLMIAIPGCRPAIAMEAPRFVHAAIDRMLVVSDDGSIAKLSPSADTFVQLSATDCSLPAPGSVLQATFLCEVAAQLGEVDQMVSDGQRLLGRSPSGVVSLTLDATGSITDAGQVACTTLNAPSGCPVLDGAIELSEASFDPATSTVYVAGQRAGDGVVGATSTPVAPEAPVVPDPTLEVAQLPTIGGAAIEGSTLTTTAAQWNLPSEVLTRTWQWQRCFGGTCTNIPGATALTYAPANDDIGATLRVQETATSGALASSATSLPTAVVVPLAPQMVSAPTISGTARENTELTADHGSWTGAALAFSHQWWRCSQAGSCTPVIGATQLTYRPTALDIGLQLKFRVLASNASGSAVSFSALTAPVLAAAPRSTRAPMVYGSAVEGARLTATAGAWASSRTFSTRFQWQRCDAPATGCVAIAGATTSAYTAAAADLQHVLRVAVTATNVGGATEAASAATPAIAIAVPVIGTLPDSVTGTSIAVTWGSNPATAAASWDLRTTSTSRQTGATATTAWLTATTLRSGIFSAQPGTTYCFTARTNNAQGSSSAWSAPRCTTTPIDDTQLTPTGAWAATPYTAALGGTLARSADPAATLTLNPAPGVHFARVLVSTCPGCGPVRISWNGTPLATVSTQTTTLRHRQYTLKVALPSDTGALTLQPSTTKPIQIDAVTVF